MKILYEQNLVDSLHRLMNKAKERIWISSPYIGSFPAVSKILGKKWQFSSKVNVRLLTDLGECSKISFETLNKFYHLGAVHTLKGLHAKIYIVDNSAIITSANLTRTAFSKRYEMGVLLQDSEAKEVILQYNSWWTNTSSSVSLQEIRDIKENSDIGSAAENDDGQNLSAKWRLPKGSQKKLPSISGQGTLQGYEYFLSCYEDFANLYSQGERVDSNVPLNLEVDGFLDFLFHHGKQPSNRYARIKGLNPRDPRKIKNRKKNILHWAEKYRDWVDDDNDIYWRVERSEIIQGILAPESIQDTNWNDLEKIANSLNCMNSLPINRAKFLNKNNNKLHDIIKALDILVHGDEDIILRLQKARNMIKHFGDSSVQELIGFYYPNIYPIRNGNSNAGLRYFGYDVSI